MYYLHLPFFIACEKDELISEPERVPVVEKTIEQITFDDLPSNVSKYFKENKDLRWQKKKASKLFGEVKKDQPIIKITSKNNIVSYTVALNKNNKTTKKEATRLYFDNLVIKQEADGTDKILVFRYTPEESWYANPEKSINTYTGNIKVFDAQGTTVGNMRMVNGKMNTKNADKLLDTVECVYEFDKVICTGGGGDFPVERCTYYYTEKCTVSSSGGGGLPGGTGGDTSGGTGNWGGSNNPPTGGGNDESGDDGVETLPILDEYLEIINELTGKAYCIYEKLKESSESFEKAIQKFDGEFPVSHLKLSMANLANNTRGRTFPPKNYIIEIQLNNDQSTAGVNYRPNLLTAKTIIHEVIHAEMFRKMISLANSNGEINVNKLNTMLQNGDYPGMLDYYTRYGINGFQHQQMAEHYRNTIGRALQEFDTGIPVGENDIPNQLYLDLAWEGFNHSDIVAWKNTISNSERTRINAAISNYINNYKNQNCIK